MSSEYGGYVIRKSKLNDIPTMQQVFSQAKEKMRASGNLLQWADVYPTNDQLKTDIERGFSYVVVKDGVIVATFVLALCPEPTYSNIYGGRWLDYTLPYGTIHRAASIHGVHGIMDIVLDWSFHKTNNIRVDTHVDNIPMQHIMSKHSFMYCGIIHLENGEERLAYQKII